MRGLVSWNELCVRKGRRERAEGWGEGEGGKAGQRSAQDAAGLFGISKEL